MPAKDLGSKHTCYKCGTKFYDMKKPVPVCPQRGVHTTSPVRASTRAPSGAFTSANDTASPMFAAVTTGR